MNFFDSWRAGGKGRGAYVLTANTTTQIPLTIQLAAGASADGFVVENSTGTDLFRVDPFGNIYIAGTVTAVVNEAITGNVSITGTLAVTGVSTLTGTVSLGNDLHVSGYTTLGNRLYSHEISMLVRPDDMSSQSGHGIMYTKTVSGLNELFYIDDGGNITQITSAGAIGGDSMQLDDDEYLGIGNTAASPDTRLGWNTTQTVDTLYLGLSDGQNTFIIAENGDRAFDFTHGAAINPTMFIHSASQNTTQWISASHNQTDAVIGTGAGDLLLTIAGGNLAPSANDGFALGTSTLGIADIHLATGAVINWVNGDITLTHAAGKLTFGGDGTVEIDFADHEMTNVDINSGAIDGTTIGGAVAAAGTFTAIVGTSLDLNGALDLDVAALGATITNTADTASSQIAIFEGDRATIADNDEAYLTFRLSDSAGNQDEGARITWKATTVLNGATQDTDLIFSALVNNVLTTMLTLDGSASEIVPAVAINSAAAITGSTITATSFVIGANTLTTAEWAFLDGQNQTVATTSNPTFGNLTITSFAANWTNAGRTVADLGIVTTADINGGTLDGTVIGGASAAALTATTGTFSGSTTFGTHDGSNFLNIERYDSDVNQYAIIRAGSADNNVPVGFEIQTRGADGAPSDALKILGGGQATFINSVTMGALTATTGTFSGLLQTVLSATGSAGFNMPHGAAPTSPVNGDMWTTTAGLFVRINGVTKTVTLT